MSEEVAHLGAVVRLRAEQQIEIDESLTADALSPGETRRLLHKLRLREIELEMQNEELRRAQGNLEASRAQYLDLYDLAPVGYLTVSEHGLILEANLTAAKLLGVTRASLITQPFSLFVLPGNQHIQYHARNQLFTTGEPQVWELQLVRKNADPFWARVEAAPAQLADGVSVYRAVVSDISVSKRAEHAEKHLDSQKQRLEKAESLARMAGAIAHHFNNHLMAVTGNLELAIADRPAGGRLSDNLSQALQGARDAVEMANLMLTYLGQTPGIRHPLDLSGVCRRCLPLLKAATRKDTALETICPAPSPIVMANASEIQKVLTNLVFNAWEARSGGRNTICVTVKTISAADIPKSHRFPIGWSPHSAGSDSAYACLQVTDEGCGIEDKDIEQIFDPFFSSKAAGRGLGLPVVLGIVRSHYGCVTVDSQPGRGSTFRVFLPLAVGAVPRTRLASKSPAVAATGIVLLVEDDPMIRKIVATMLKRLDFPVIEASDGIEAVEIFERRKDEVSCVLCDLTMPRMNGWQTLADLRRISPGVPVILSSGYDEAEVMAGDHTESPQVFLGKPFTLKGLREAIGRAMLLRKG